MIVGEGGCSDHHRGRRYAYRVNLQCDISSDFSRSLSLRLPGPATAREILAHAEMMKKHRHMKHDEPNAVTLAPKQSAELLWKFTKAGTFEYSCLIPNHREYGMTGRVTVR